MKPIHQFFVFCFLLSFLSCNQSDDTKWSVFSVDGNIKMELKLENGKLFYTVSSKSDKTFSEVIKKSPIGISRKDADFSGNLSFVEAKPVIKINEHYNVLTGKKLNLQNLANELLVSFSDAGSNQLNVALRAYNDGIAFRYIFPEEKTGEFVVIGESTGFSFPEGKAWIQPYDDVTKYTPAYEAFYENAVDIGQNSPKKNGWCFPALFYADSTWILLSEAGLDGDFYGAHLNPDIENNTYTIRLPEMEEAMGIYKQEAFSDKLPWSSPWRVAIISNNLQGIIASNMVKHLSQPNRVKDTSWIKPGRSSWSWLSDHDSPQDFNKLKSFVDLAVEMNWEYSLVDANWNLMKGGNIEQLVEYANSKGIGILMWYNSGGPHNEVEEQVRDIMDNPEKRKAEFDKLQKWGVKGIKVDFFQSDKPGMMKLYKDILEDAAEHQILVNFHGCTIPRGWSRTYPNLMSMESVRGAESYTFAEDYPMNVPVFNTILPVTRNVIGSMDYTPVIFSDMKYPHVTSYGHELALSVLFESGWLHMADAVESYQNLPEAPKEFLRNIPVNWDEIQFVYGWPGKEMVLARRKGDVWYVAGINGENTTKNITIMLPFLAEGEFQAELITDGDSPRNLTNQTFKVDNRNPLELTFLPFGGFVITIKPSF